jgi:hypothetical protein
VTSLPQSWSPKEGLRRRVADIGLSESAGTTPVGRDLEGVLLVLPLGAEPNVSVNEAESAVVPNGERPAAGEAEAAMCDEIVMDTSPAASCSYEPHEIHPLPYNESAELSADCFSVVGLKQRALSMSIVPVGGAPRASRSRRVMAATTALLIINVTKVIEQLMGMGIEILR